MSDLSDKIALDAAKAASVTNDGVTVVKRSLSEQIAADKYLRSVEATASPAATLASIVTRMIPPGGH